MLLFCKCLQPQQSLNGELIRSDFKSHVLKYAGKYDVRNIATSILKSRICQFVKSQKRLFNTRVTTLSVNDFGSFEVIHHIQHVVLI